MGSLSKEFRVLNDEFTSPAPSSATIETVSFFPFSRLPLELRLKIWRQCFPLNRFISICVADPIITYTPRSDLPGAQKITFEPYTTRNHLGNVISGYPYQLLVPRFDQWSRVLLWVNREAQRTFLDFYRVSVPLQYGAFWHLHLNPETDILEVHRDHPNNINVLVGFLHDVIAYDPRGIGITQLALGRDLNDVPHLAYLDPFNMNSSAVQAIKTLLSNSLQIFYSCIPSSVEARTMLGMLPWPRNYFHCNRSVPIAAQNTQNQATDFTLLRCDPRPIETDLSHVDVGMDPRRTLYFWHKLLVKFGVPIKPSGELPMKTMLLQAIWPHDQDPIVANRGGFIDYLVALNVRWAKWAEEFGRPLWGNRITEQEYQRLQKELCDVAGIWIYDANAFGNIPELRPESEDISIQWGYKMVADLTDFRPQLMVFNLNNDPK